MNIIALTSNIQNTHFGSNSDDSDDYSAQEASGFTCDTRAEVILLSSNVRIVGDTTTKWGATLVNTDYTDPVGT